MNIKTLTIVNPQIEEAQSIKEVLCLATLIATGELPPNATINDSRNFFKEETKSNCFNCPFSLTCLGSIISNS